MKIKRLLAGLILLAFGFTAFGYTPTWDINFQNCSDPQRLEKLLDDQFDAVWDELTIATLQGTGNYFYVDSGVGSNTYDGKDWAHAKATLDAAVALCTANNGDVIFVAAGHNESLTGADGVDLDVAGITVIGLGNGYDRPRFDYDNAAGEFVIGAASVSVFNLQFLPSVTIVTHAIDIENAGDYALISHCAFLDGEAAGTDEFVDTIQVGTTATDATIQNCWYYSTGTGSNNVVDLSAATIANATVRNCVFYGAFAEAGIWASNAVPTNVFIENCIITNTTASQFCIEFQGAATGVVRNCVLAPATIAYGIDPGSLAVYNVDEKVPGTDTIAGPALPIVDNSANIYGADNNNNVFASTNVASNRDGSLIERLEFLCKYFENGTPGALVAPASTFSLLDILGSDGSTTTGAVAGSILGAIGTNEVIANTPFTSGTVTADHDGSVLERLEALEGGMLASPSYFHPNYFKVSADMTSATWNTQAAHEIAVVTGTVRIRILSICSGTLTDTGGLGTLTLGTEGNAAQMIASTDSDDVLVTEFWNDATPTVAETDTFATTCLDFVVCAGKDVGYTIGGEALTGGVLDFHIWWAPLDSAGVVTAGAGGAF